VLRKLKGDRDLRLALPPQDYIGICHTWASSINDQFELTNGWCMTPEQLEALQAKQYCC